ncbi:MAG: methionine biosynthesis protein MetW [Verrucomicrobiota bacterium]
MKTIQFSRDTAFESAVKLLRTPPENYRPVIPDVSQAKPLPDSAYSQRIQWLAERIPAGSRLLDLGCGRGEILHFLERERKVKYLGLEREPDHLASCCQVGVKAIAADFNNLADPALRYACSQQWDTVIIIDSLVYWRCPSVVLAALSDRCERAYISVNNVGHARFRWRALCGADMELPNSRGSLAKGNLEFSTDWYNQRWTLDSFVNWGTAMGYNVRPVARRSVNAKYLPLGFLPGLTARSLMFELTPSGRKA